MSQTEIELLRPTARLEHRSPGRARARIARLERSSADLRRVEQRLRAHPAVESVIVNPQSGSILVHGDSDSDLTAALRGALNLVEAVEGRNPDEAAARIANAVEQANQRIQTWTNGRVSIKLVVPSLFVGFGIRQLLREGLTVGAVPWYVLVYYGVDSFLKMYPNHAPAGTRTTHSAI